jgi:hypothetical protein
MRGVANRSARIGALLLSLSVVGAPIASAQQTIFNVPSSEVAERGRTFIELTSSFRPFGTHYSTFLPRVIVGVGRGVELGAGVFDTEGRTFGETTALELSAKWRFFNSEETGTQLAVTTRVNVPLRGQPEKGSFLTFAGLHQLIKPTRTRISGGVFNGTPRSLRPENLTGGWASIEQPIHRGLSFVADWMSGNHRLGFFTPGLSFKSSHHYFRAGYQIGNGSIDSGLNGFVVRYGVWF